MFGFHTNFDEQTKTWSGPKGTTLYNPEVSVGKIVENALNLLGDCVVQICHDDGSEMTASELKTLSVRAAIAFHEDFGLKPGDRITFVTKNTKYLAATIFGAVFSGNPFCPVEPFLIVPEMAKLLEVTQPKLIICDEEYEELSMEAAMKCGLDVKIGKLLGIKEPEFFKPNPKELMYRVHNIKNGDEIVGLMCSSGTTGFPKLIPLTHKALSGNNNSIMPNRVPSFSFTYIYWNYSGLFYLFAAISVGQKRIISSEAFSPDLLIEILNKYKIDTLLIAPFHIQLFQEEAAKRKVIFPYLRRVFTVGCKLLPHIWEKCRLSLPNVSLLIHGYGMTECGGISANFNPKAYDSDGVLLPNVKARILDEDQNRLGIGEVGEICIKPSFKFLGYFNDEEATIRVLIDGGWLLTGDNGYFDEKGLLYVLDRKKDVIKYANYLITATEIELVISQIPGVRLACVVGIPDPLQEQLPAVLIIKDDNHPLTGQEVCDYIGHHLNERKQMRGGVYFVDDLPMTTASRKFQKSKIVEIATKLYSSKKYDYIFN